MKKLLAIASLVSIILYFPACTKGTKEDSSDVTQAEAGGLEIPEAAASGNPDETQAGFLDDQLPEDALGSVPPSDKIATEPPPAENSLDSKDSPPPLDLNSQETQPVVMATEPPQEEKPKNEAPPKPMAALQKVKEVPFRQDGQLLNAVYIARPKDNFSKISKMIYGNSDKATELKSANPGMKTVKAGNKVYYNSPKRPEDESRIMNYYEEAGVPPEIYIAKDGENIKNVSKELLGYPEAWKEVWATNSVESKNKLSAGTELRFWRGSESTTGVVGTTPPAQLPQLGADGSISPPNLAENKMPDMPLPPPPSEASIALPPPPPPDLPPPPPPQLEAKVPDLPPPPPAQEQMAPPPPAAAPAPVARKAKPVPKQEDALDQDTIMAMGGAGIVAAALAALIVIRKRKQNAAEFGNQTHVG